MEIFIFAREQGSENRKRSWKDEGSFKGAVKKAADRASTPGEMTAEPAPTGKMQMFPSLINTRKKWLTAVESEFSQGFLSQGVSDKTLTQCNCADR